MVGVPKGEELPLGSGAHMFKYNVQRERGGASLDVAVAASIVDRLGGFSLLYPVIIVI